MVMSVGSSTDFTGEPTPHNLRVHRLKEELRALNPDAILFDDLDEALVGIGSQYPGNPCAVYSEQKILRVLRSSMGNTDESYIEAVEWYEFNIACLHAGPYTPIIINLDI